MARKNEIKIYRPEVERKKDKRALMRKELHELINQRYKIERRIKEIKDTLNNADEQPKELTVSAHAIQRFKERIMKVPDKVARKVLAEETLLERYKKKGSGRFTLSGYPNVVVVIANFEIVTCYNKFDAPIQLKALKKYMDLYINILADNAMNSTIYPLALPSFESFQREMYK